MWPYPKNKKRVPKHKGSEEEKPGKNKFRANRASQKAWGGGKTVWVKNTKNEIRN